MSVRWKGEVKWVNKNWFSGHLLWFYIQYFRWRLKAPSEEKTFFISVKLKHVISVFFCIYCLTCKKGWIEFISETRQDFPSDLIMCFSRVHPWFSAWTKMHVENSKYKAALHCCYKIFLIRQRYLLFCHSHILILRDIRAH